MSTNRKLQSAIHLALGLSAGVLAVSVVPNVFAQGIDAQDADADEAIEEVIVTGSRIRRADIDSASPVTILDRETIIAAGITDVGDLIQSMPSMSGSPIGTTTNNGGDGRVLIDLRGMGTDRTLTLINGQRVVDSGDYQTIPATMIERVEILKDGASAVYGADAVAGVVNIITRRDFDGIEFTYQYADWFDTDGASQGTVSVIAGKEFAEGNFVFGAEYVNQEEAFQGDVPWEFMWDSYYIDPEGCENQLTDPYDGTPSGGCYRSGSSAIPEGRFNLLTQGQFLVGTPATQPYEVGLIIPHDGRNYNYAPVNYLQTPYKRTNIFMEGHFDITDTIRFNSEFRANFRESSQELAPTPYFSLNDPGFEGTFDGVAYNGMSEDNYYLRRAIDAYNSANGTALFYEPAVDLRRRMFEQPRRFEQEIVQFQFVAGLEGEFNDMDWEVFINAGHRSRTDQDFGQYVASRLGPALGPSADMDGDGQPECYGDVNDPATIIDGCVPLNIIGGGEVVRETGEVVVSTVTQDMLDYISAVLTDTYVTESTIGGANLTGSNFELPGGELGWAVGYGYWKQKYKYSPDSGKAVGSVTGNKGAGTNGSLTNNSIYGEVLAPVYDNGTQNIYLKGGLRYDEWDAFDGDTTYQLGVEFQAIESVKLRATYGTVFRAPTISDLFGGKIDSFPTFSDPCASKDGGPIAPGCDREAPGDEGQLLAEIGGNPNLIPETGDTFTAGVVWTPQFGDHSFTATVDYWEIDIEDGISSLGVNFILTDCYVNLNPTSCDLITRRPQDYGIDRVIDGSLNVADQGAKGIDTELRWGYDSSIGQWNAAMLWSHLLERTKTPFEGAEEDDLSGRYTDPTAEDGGAYASDKVNFNLQWMRGDFSVSYLAEYISGLDADTFCNCGVGNTPAQDGTYIQDIDSFLYHDLIATYAFSSYGLELTAGITNIGDKAPPFIDTGFNATTDPATYRMFGRGYYLRFQWKY
jgi:outer membrane receptor protein involved in Fe transport